MKSKLGSGTPLVVKFFAPLDLENLDAEIVYDYRGLGSDGDIVRSGDDICYCLK